MTDVRLADIAHSIAQEQHYLPLAGLSKWTGGWASAALGDPQGLDQAIAGVNELAGIGVGAGAPGCMAVLAEMCATAGRLEEGFGYAQLGEMMADDSGQHFYTVEVYRSTALLHIATADQAQDPATRVAAMVNAESAARR
ncbi:MAG: hypothetical protein O7F73_00845, partial [Gammaproteobacteria bacterium]|nr:hypothetical protein [Gammaproteobacteria bacterium]